MTPDEMEGREGALTIDDRLWVALARHGRGDLTAEETAELWRWAGDNPERARMLRGAQQFGEVARQLAVRSGADAGWERIRRRLAPPRRAAVLRLGAIDLPRRAPWRRAGGVAAAAAIAAAVSGGVILLQRRQVEPLPAVREASTTRGERATFQLVDGSRVVLAPESRIRYVIGPGAPARTVRLEGTALFTVASDPRRPFVVYAARGAVQAVGTEFGVRSYPGDSTVQVVVASGRVALRPAAEPMGSGTVLDRGDLGVLDAAGDTRVETGVDVDRFLGWARGRLSYELAPLAHVIRDLERWYEVDITVDDPSWNRIRITVSIEPGSIDLALRRVSTVLGLRYTRTGSTARIIR